MDRWFLATFNVSLLLFSRSVVSNSFSLYESIFVLITSTNKRLTLPTLKHIAFISGFPDGSVGKESTCNAGDPGSIPGSGRSAGEGIGYPLQYSGLENSMDCIVHGVGSQRVEHDSFHTSIYFHTSKNTAKRH